MVSVPKDTRAARVGRDASRDLSHIRVAIVFRDQPLHTIKAHDMSTIRWLCISRALSHAGFSVDVIVNSENGVCRKGPNLRYVPKSRVDWNRYDVVKTLFHTGFDALTAYGGDSHPFIISKLGSVVGSRDGIDGVHFYGREREGFFETQRAIADKSRYVTILTEESSALWAREHGGGENILRVPTGVDRMVPLPSRNPYREFSEKIAVFIGNFYAGRQAEVNRLWQLKLNDLGHLLRGKGIRLCVVGNGNSDVLDHRCVTYLGPVDHSRIWDYQYHANIGIVLAQGNIQHNESSKIYYYLRTGLRVVSERPVPNNHLIRTTGLGYVAEFNDSIMMADMIEAAANASWDSRPAIELMVKHHTWDDRVETYKQLICRELSLI